MNLGQALNIKRRRARGPQTHREELVGEEGLEPSASASRTLRATKLRHSPARLIVALRVERAQCGVHADMLNGGYRSVASKNA